MKIKVVFKLVATVAIFALQVEAISLDFRRNSNSVNETSCVGKCDIGLIPGAPCQCNSACERFGDCCADYAEICLGIGGTCAGRCGQSYDPTQVCQCNSVCADRGDCCKDYTQLCGGGGSSDLEQLAEELLTLDVNNVAHLVTVSPDVKPFIRFKFEIFEKPTISKLVRFYDNFVPRVEITEVVTPEEEEEEKQFLDAVFSTPVMIRAQQFLSENGYDGSREHLTKLWFGLYNRGSGKFGSNGFEHVFLGEIMNNGISGFHNWLYFATEELYDNVENGVVAKLLDFGKGWVVENSMSWLGYRKPIGGGFIGTSPEFEMAIYSVCYLVKPNARCPISLNGNKLNIQTYKTSPSHSTTDTYISTSYTILP